MINALITLAKIADELLYGAAFYTEKSLSKLTARLRAGPLRMAGITSNICFFLIPHIVYEKCVCFKGLKPAVA
jgi:hypothetical protein